MGFWFEEFETVVCCPSIDIVHVQFELAFYYVDVFGSVAYDEIVNIQITVNSRAKAAEDAVNFLYRRGCYHVGSFPLGCGDQRGWIEHEPWNFHQSC